MPSLLSGQCLCGSVQYSVQNEFEYALNCHCSQCRRSTSAAFKSLAGIPSSKIFLKNDHGSLLIFGNTQAAHDVRCRHCGSLMYSVVREGAYVHLAMGTLSEVPSIAPTMHIFVASKAEWYEITDGLPQHATLPDD